MWTNIARIAVNGLRQFALLVVGGAGINYQQRDNVVPASIRLGVGLRAGASIGYSHYTKTKTLNPF